MNIGERRRTIYIEPIEEPSAAPAEEPSSPVDPDPSESPHHVEPEPAG
jgi:hypothetical protein